MSTKCNSKRFVGTGKIPDSLVINWDQTGIQYIPVCSWTVGKEGTKRVKTTGPGKDKQQITAVLQQQRMAIFCLCR